MDPALSPAIARSFQIYRSSAERDSALDAFYAPFVRSGALVFDIGAHVGDRTVSFRRLGARVIALEPQAECAALIRRDADRLGGITLIEAAVGAIAGTAVLHCNADNPTVSTLSDRFIAAADGAPGWEGQKWNVTREVQVLTLDRLIVEYGSPEFIKIDVEGYEHEALKGLSSSVGMLSFEFTTIQRDIAIACIERCCEIGFHAFRGSLGESLAFVHDEQLKKSEIIRWLEKLSPEANSGDIYCSQA